jgi:lysozyme family protein
VTWPHIAVLHRRESDADFDTYLGNGEPLNRVTRLVPKGRGPFTGPDAFEKGAIDALHLDGLDEVPDWRLEKILYYCEVFNGAGYANRGLPSPYVWGGTNQQRPGKYVADGVFDPNTMDRQPGCAPILAMIAKLDPSVKFVRETPMGVEPPSTPEPPMADADMKAVLDAVEKLASEITITRMEVATLRSLVTGKPVEKPPDKPVEKLPVVKPGPIAETLQSNSMQITTIAGMAIWALQAFGVLPPGVGELATQFGAILTAAPIGSAAISATGGWGGIATLLGRLTGRNK